MAPPSNFPLRWESTGDQWWYASPIDWAAANGHYDLVRELLRLDGNHLIKLTSLRRTRRLEIVWDDEEQFHDVTKCRSEVARKLFLECEVKGGKNSLIRASYGGWLLYTAASAGDLGFVQEILVREPLLVFGEGEYGVTDILYAAARSKNSEVFRFVFDFAVSPRFLTGKAGEYEEHIGEIPPEFKCEMMNRAVHAAARGGNLQVLKELLSDCSDVLAYKDTQGSTILHAAAGRGQVQVVKDLIASFDIVDSIDNQGNTALHVAAYRGQLAVVEAIICASPSSIFLKNNAGETFLHMAVSGFQTAAFRRLDRQIELMKQLVSGKVFNLEDIVNAKNNEGRTALHMAIIGNIHSDLVQLLMIVRSIDVNVRDLNGMTPLDILRQRPLSASSEMLTRHLISAGGIFGCHDYMARRRAIVSHLKLRGNGNSPGTSFKVTDSEILLYTGIENGSDATAGRGSIGMSSDSTELSHFDTTNENHTNENHSSSDDKRDGAVTYAAKRLKRLLHWPRVKEKTPGKFKKTTHYGSAESSSMKCSSLNETPIPLRQRFSKPSSLPNNKRTLSVRSNLPSPTAKKKFASGIKNGVMQAIPHLHIPRRSRSSSFSTVSSLSSVDKQKEVNTSRNDTAGPSCSNQMFDDRDDDDITPNFVHKQGSLNKRLMNQYFCFGASGLPTKGTVRGRHQQNQTYKRSVLSVA